MDSMRAFRPSAMAENQDCSEEGEAQIRASRIELYASQAEAGLALNPDAEQPQRRQQCQRRGK